MLSYGNLTERVVRRVADLTAFLRQAGLVVNSQSGDKKRETSLRFRSLAGDSHNGGKRPLLLEYQNRPMVLKFTDPRPYQLLGYVLSALSNDTGIDLIPPSIIADEKCQWYLMPFIGAKKAAGGQYAEEFMYALGALTAVAYGLRMVDLHLENLIVANGKPIIIDPECILYNFVPDDPADRLLSTGLLSHNPGLSALRGGDLSKQKVVQIDPFLRRDGVLDYNKPVGAFHNRFRSNDGELADPAGYRSALIGGFDSSYRWFLSNRQDVSDILSRWVHDDFRIRYLVRKTRLYAAVIHMLNLPVSCSYEDWRDNIFSQFRAAGYFPDRLETAMFVSETHDLNARDIPYFWVNAGEPMIQHRTGSCQKILWGHRPLEQAIIDIHRMSHSDLKRQTRILNDFLDKELNDAAIDE